MRIGLITIGVLSTLVTVSAEAQNPAGASAPAPPTQPTPTPPAALQQQQSLPPGLRPRSQIASPGETPRNNLTPAPAMPENGTTATLRDQARTPADQALLVQVQQTVQALQVRFPGTSPWTPVHFNVDNGVVTLMGTVPNEQREEQLEGVVQQVPGVTGIVDQLTVAGSAGQGAGMVGSTDRGLLLRIRQTVLPQIEVAGTPVPINFNVQQGIVTINGVLPNLAQKRQLTALVRQVPGVLQVNNQVALNPNAAVSGALSSGIQPGAMPQNSVGSALTPGQMEGVNNTLTPTGRTNAVGLPPGLENRNPLPPGLEDRTQLPPGLSNDTNQVPRMNR